MLPCVSDSEVDGASASVDEIIERSMVAVQVVTEMVVCEVLHTVTVPFPDDFVVGVPSPSRNCEDVTVKAATGT